MEDEACGQGVNKEELYGMQLNYTIRMANHTDIPHLLKLLELLFAIESDFTIDEQKQRHGLNMMLDDDAKSCIMVAQTRQMVVGMCTAQILVSTAEGGVVALIEDLVVSEECRGKGIGKGLLASIENWAIARGARRLQLLADRNNIAALEFYKKMNWSCTQLICLHRK